MSSIRLSAPGCGPSGHAAPGNDRRATAAESDDEADSRANSEDWEEAPSQIQLAQVPLPAVRMLTWPPAAAHCSPSPAVTRHTSEDWRGTSARSQGRPIHEGSNIVDPDRIGPVLMMCCSRDFPACRPPLAVTEWTGAHVCRRCHRRAAGTGGYCWRSRTPPLQPPVGSRRLCRAPWCGGCAAGQPGLCMLMNARTGAGALHAFCLVSWPRWDLTPPPPPLAPS